MTNHEFDRRRFLRQAAAGVGVFTASLALASDDQQPSTYSNAPRTSMPEEAEGNIVRKDYKGPNVILVRFGGGVRRLETIASPEKTYCPFIYHDLYKNRGTLLANIEIEAKQGIDTSHGQGTLYLLTGQYRHYEDITNKPFADRFEAADPTIFEYFRKTYSIPEHQALIVNGEDRINEEFYTISNHHLFGVRYRATVLSLYRFKTYLLREELKDRNLSDQEREAQEKQLRCMETKDYRVRDHKVASPELDGFWAR